MSIPDEVTPRPPGAQPGAGRDWTRLEDYLDLGRLWRRAARRNRRRLQPRTEPSQPHFTLGVLPFLLLMAAMAILAFLFILAAVPGKHRPDPPPEKPPLGTAPPGWFQG